MKKRIFMYLFLFALLLLLFQYVNQTRIFKKQTEQIESLRARTTTLTDSIAWLQTVNHDLDYFRFLGNDEAMTYYENQGWEAQEVYDQVRTELYEGNRMDQDHPLVPYEGMEGPMRINKVRQLNHRWIIADFTDGRYWGEILIRYYLDERDQMTYELVDYLLYPI